MGTAQADKISFAFPQPLKPMERNGPGLEYRVNWRQQGVETDWNEELVKNHWLSVRNVPTFVPYEIKVQAVNNLGSGPEPNITIGYSGEDGEWQELGVSCAAECRGVE